MTDSRKETDMPGVREGRFARECGRIMGLAGVICLGTALCGGAPAAADPPDFTEQAEFGANGATITVAWGDAERDGDLDLAVGNYSNGQNYLYFNNGDGTFTEEARFGLKNTFALVWGDYDNDGDLDVAVGNGNGAGNRLTVNAGDGTFTGQGQFGDLTHTTIALAWGDADNDGDLDMAVGNGILGSIEQNYLYLNNGDGTFTEQAQFGTSQTASLVWGDYDGDDDLDLAVGNGGFGSEEQNYLYINNGDGTFTEQALFGVGDTSCLVWGDADNDGDLDLAVANWNGGQNYLYVNNGDGTFTEQAQFGQRDPNTMAWGDYDNDGDLDLAVGNGDFGSADQNYLYINNGDGTFTQSAQFGLGSTDALVWGDFDSDGDLDVAAGNEHSTRQNYLYINHEDDADYLILRLVGHFHDRGAGYSNRDGIGAKIAAYAAGHVGEPNHLLAFRQVEAHGGFAAQSAIDPHFGFPGRASVDLRITWPGSGGSRHVQDVTGVSIGQVLTIHEGPTGTSAPRLGSGDVVPRLEARPNPMHQATEIELAGEGIRSAHFEIFDVRGRCVRRLDARPPGSLAEWRARWDGLDEAGARVAAGVYFVRTREETGIAPLRIVVLR
jgi:hypothetical protein